MTILLFSSPIIAKCAQDDTASLAAITSCPALLSELKQAAVKTLTSEVAEPDSASEYSETNVQVVGVDEADFVKIDKKD